MTLPHILAKLTRHLELAEMGGDAKLDVKTAELRALVDAVTWRPIEALTPSNRRVLLYALPGNLVVDGNSLTKFTEEFVFSAHWDDIDDCWVMDGGSWLGPFVLNPIAWMPLPEKPEADQ